MMKPNKPTNEEKVIGYVLLGDNGFSEREGVFELNFTSGRNYINKLEEKLQIEFHREWEKTADGENRYYRYSIPDRQTAQKLISYANSKSAMRGKVTITESQAERILNRFAEK
ncbi:hypothetical protein CDE51_03160 [Pasteurella multocida]|uniref:hypothetical protein n=1 Tax=Pasteurella multocida TaxID=747 RepID=UPI000B76349F|nr:hypothetical protein [Pasteurella multocida]MBM2609388.1 hypothetical protein [Pasteurella multocida]NNI30470.1 hypothetical protein [Pasteurella multocida]NNI60810.1 hypothetical protein [Pasteurella multocida]NNI75823.1 hypothetical protein [Pasteurella multocida]OWZ82236.1 hypothetical protein CDE51_03160 [Pasteurella multocida]